MTGTSYKRQGVKKWKTDTPTANMQKPPRDGQATGSQGGNPRITSSGSTTGNRRNTLPSGAESMTGKESAERRRINAAVQLAELLRINVDFPGKTHGN